MTATNCKPCLGYSSIGAACIALKAEGRTWTEIGRILNKTPRACSSLATRARQRGERSVRTVKLKGNVFLDLEREARRRDMTADQFAERLLNAIVIDSLYSAVLDD